MKMTNFVERLKMLPMAQKENKSYYKQEPCYLIINKNFIVISKYIGKFEIMNSILECRTSDMQFKI